MMCRLITICMAAGLFDPKTKVEIVIFLKRICFKRTIRESLTRKMD